MIAFAESTTYSTTFSALARELAATGITGWEAMVLLTLAQSLALTGNSTTASNICWAIRQLNEGFSVDDLIGMWQACLEERRKGAGECRS